ncbi:maleylacetate reductase [Pelagibacterium halotolerans]|uniref:Alcohol dehydrogenase n=1 Tax=Pelagibacterium halotolerans (strain DSM 22347 / JCM 15775 / CGMCC 1.7692 / B2) TaxID=1082931 RepID=G4R9G6_PELHB|nr:maleylacetate reductase [Pelagibacterium halotolerans]AEQ50386.1 Alcohol dehydrogenase [Pelagibacterium halotolerans B2]QJR19638.1 maleylacetate reductase [Pelagibacterium halotolerans]SDZ85975.1 maleylacetate reductase [Pelagibacterium halotolerans]
MLSFTHRQLPATIRFGAGCRHELKAILETRNLMRALVLTTPEQAHLGRSIADEIGPLCAGVFEGARMHTPMEVTRDTMALAQSVRADCLVAIGGGSTTGLGKAVSVRSGLPQFVIPTTYAGSEVTPVLGETENARKTTRRADAILPGLVLYDPELTYSLPASFTLTSAVNAMAHAAEALYAPDCTPIIRLMAYEAVGVMMRALPKLYAEPANAEARAEALYAAWLCGTCLGATTMGLHHKICHVLGGTFDLPHAPTHCIMLPHVLAYNKNAAPGAYADLALAMGTERPELAIYDMVLTQNGPVALSALGMTEHGIGEVITQLRASPYANPAPLDETRLRTMLANALAGRAPDAALPA